VTSIEERLSSNEIVRTVRAALADRPDAWIVGGTLRDALLGRELRDVDVSVAGDPEPVAGAVARAMGGPVFPLNVSFGAWRALDRDHGWVVDVSPLHGSTIEDDLAQRDFTVNAMALPLAGGEALDPHGGLADLEARILRVLGEHAYESDPLRPLRLARLATELPLAPDAETERLTRKHAARVPEAAAERIWGELKHVVCAERVIEGLELMGRLGLEDAVLPELASLRDVEQSQYHHLDVHGHTMEVLRRLLGLEHDLESVFGELASPLQEVLSEPLADELTRGQALRFGALFHDIAKPPTRGELPDGRITFMGHDRLGEDMVADISRRLRASERFSAFVRGLTRHHLRLGFMVHERPLSREAIYRYLDATDPVEVEVTVLSCADRLATRGRKADEAIEAHLELGRQMLAEALRWREQGRPQPAIRGDDLASELGIEPGPELGGLLDRLREARFTGEAGTRAQAVEYARRLRDNSEQP
jgi:tRNA nucleotidyltransferase/poly(A) polymerase